MNETSLITITNLRDYVDLQPTYDQERFDMYVRRAQRNQLRYLLGDRLYYDFWDKVAVEVRYQELRDGKTYQYNSDVIQYFGFKPFLLFHVAAILVYEGDLQLTEFGAQQYTDNYSKHNNRRDIRNDFLAEAERYGNEIIKFLDKNYADFPLWDSKKYDNPTNSAFFIY